MTEPGSRIMTPFIPNLEHCATVKIAVQLFEKFGIDRLEEAFMEIKEGNETSEETPKRRKFNKAKKKLLDIPPHLRGQIMEAAYGSEYAASCWRACHAYFQKSEKNIKKFLWRSDVSIDATKTAQNLVRNTKFDIRKRFLLACEYCLFESVLSLWNEMVEKRKIESSGGNFEGLAGIWETWLSMGSRVPWTQCLLQYLLQLQLHVYKNGPRILFPRFSVLFTLLEPAERQQLFHLLECATLDDLRFCSYAVTDSEEKEMLKLQANQLLRLHLEWPLQTLFLEKAKELWNYIREDKFHSMVIVILTADKYNKDFNYSTIFDKFRNMSPIQWRESDFLKRRLDSYFAKKERKRSSTDNEQRRKKIGKKKS